MVGGDGIEYRDRPSRKTADPFEGSGPGESSARQVVLERDPDRTPHLHPRSEEVVYVAEGSGRVWIDGEFHEVSAGSWVRIPPSTPHATIPTEGDRMTLICFFPHPHFEDNIEELDIVIQQEENP